MSFSGLVGHAWILPIRLWGVTQCGDDKSQKNHKGIDSPFERVVLIGGADPRATQPENPTLAHLGQ